MLHYYRLICAFLLVIFGNFAQAQTNVSRYATYEGFLDSISHTQILPKGSMVMQNARGYFSKENQTAWGAFLTENIEFIRWKNRNIIAFQALQEVNADLLNDIGFNPKIATWMEQFYYLRKTRNGQVSLGIQHRSKHDIDNGEPIVWDTTRRFLPESRVIILNGPYGTWQRNYKLSESISAKLLLRYEYYWISYDSRFPYKNLEQSWKYAKSSALLSLYTEKKLHKNWSIFQQSWLNPVYFTKDTPLKLNYRVELGLNLIGSAAKGKLFIAYEHFFDNLMNPFPFDTSTLWFGARVSGKNIW